MSAKRERLIKLTDESTPIRCVVGMGEIREEVWTDAGGIILRYNLAFICFGLYAGDNGRVLGYDTAHGYLHRHLAGKVEPVSPTPYSEVLRRFTAEVAELKHRSTLWI